jgi:hypothetical protein
MSDLPSGAHHTARALLETQLAETERLTRLLDAQYAVLSRDGNEATLVLLDEADDATARLDGCRARLQPLLLSLRSERHEGPNARAVRRLLASVESEASRAQMAAARLASTLQRVAEAAGTELASVDATLRAFESQGGYGQAAGAAHPPRVGPALVDAIG